jgi:dTDP-4-dehydrorhamnose reductase
MRSLALVIGAAGQLGAAMVEGLARRHEVVAMTRGDADLTAASATRDRIVAVCPDMIINCAAYNNVDGAEREPAEALAANAWGVRTLARIAAEIDATLVHFSTDFVFDGVSDRPYTELDTPNPRGTYASSKLLGEWFAAETPRHYVLRVESLFGGPRARSSVDRLLSAIRSNQEVRAFADRTVSPSYVEDVVAATMGLIERGPACGTYHVVNTGWTNWADLSRELAALAGHPEASIVEVRMADAGLTAPRPQFAALSNAKLANAGVLMPTWQDALARYVALTA